MVHASPCSARYLRFHCTYSMDMCGHCMHVHVHIHAHCTCAIVCVAIAYPTVRQSPLVHPKGFHCIAYPNALWVVQGNVHVHDLLLSVARLGRVLFPLILY